LEKQLLEKQREIILNAVNESYRFVDIETKKQHKNLIVSDVLARFHKWRYDYNRACYAIEKKGTTTNEEWKIAINWCKSQKPLGQLVMATMTSLGLDIEELGLYYDPETDYIMDKFSIEQK
jgi:hypothetical protein